MLPRYRRTNLRTNCRNFARSSGLLSIKCCGADWSRYACSGNMCIKVAGCKSANSWSHNDQRAGLSSPKIAELLSGTALTLKLLGTSERATSRAKFPGFDSVPATGKSPMLLRQFKEEHSARTTRGRKSSKKKITMSWENGLRLLRFKNLTPKSA